MSHKSTDKKTKKLTISRIIMAIESGTVIVLFIALIVLFAPTQNIAETHVFIEKDSITNSYYQEGKTNLYNRLFVSGTKTLGEKELKVSIYDMLCLSTEGSTINPPYDTLPDKCLIYQFVEKNVGEGEYIFYLPDFPVHYKGNTWLITWILFDKHGTIVDSRGDVYEW